MLLFADQNDPSYPDRFRAAASLFRHLPEETPVLESAWFSESHVEPERGVRYYGIGYSHSTADFPKAMVELTRRMMLPERQLCRSCPRSKLSRHAGNAMGEDGAAGKGQMQDQGRPRPAIPRLSVSGGRFFVNSRRCIASRSHRVDVLEMLRRRGRSSDRIRPSGAAGGRVRSHPRECRDGSPCRFPPSPGGDPALRIHPAEFLPVVGGSRELLEAAFSGDLISKMRMSVLSVTDTVMPEAGDTRSYPLFVMTFRVRGSCRP